MRIGELAGQAGVKVETVRFYECEGLLQKPPRRDSGYRDYPEESLARLRFIRHGKALGFSLPEIHELLWLRSSSETPCGDVQRRVEAKLEDVRQKIRSLEQIRSKLEELAATCVAGGSSSECPILEVLERVDEETA